MDTLFKINDLTKRITTLKDDYIVKRSKEKDALNKKEELERELSSLRLADLEKCLAVLQKMSAKQRDLARARLEGLGTAALQYSMGSNYKMEIEIPPSKKKPQAKVFIVNKSTGAKTDPMEANGGGVVDIVSIALRFVVMQNYVPFIDGPIIMDEPFKMVSKEYIPMLSEFIKNISQDFGRQIIIVTHNEYLAAMADCRIRIAMDDNNVSIAFVEAA
jgi:DNA repair exonuclease SbcCD ATPase subunit